MGKRIVFCFDGTWNALAPNVTTNVARLAQMVRPVARDGTAQVVYYDEGIGTNTNWLRKHWQGATGSGMLEKLREAYRFLIFNYEPGDEIFAFGFSRGAFTARSFVGFIRHSGVLDVVSAEKIEQALALYRVNKVAGKTGQESGQLMRFRLRHCRAVCVSQVDRTFRIRAEPAGGHADVPLLSIRYLGLWDTVKALGVPGFVPFARWINRRSNFHKPELTSKVQSARHAIALDELRPTFRDVPFAPGRVAELNLLAGQGRELPFEQWELPFQEKWFPGVHGAVGGGGSVRGQSDGALAWVLAGARSAGLEMRDDDDAQTFSIAPDPMAPLRNESAVHLLDRGLFGWLKGLLMSPRKGPGSLDEVSLPALRRWYAAPGILPEGGRYRPKALAGLAGDIELWPFAYLFAQPPGEYRVQHGDTLAKIAKERLGVATAYMEIFDANRDQMDDPGAVYVGMRLRMPG